MHKKTEIKVQNYIFEFWETESGKIVGPKINNHEIDTMDEERLFYEAKKVYPSPKHTIRFTPFEIIFE